MPRVYQGAGRARDAAADYGGWPHLVRPGEAACEVPRAPRRAGGARDRVAPGSAGARPPAHRRLVVRRRDPPRRGTARERAVSGPAGFLNAFAHELKAWDWGQRLALAGIQRLEFSDPVSREEFVQFLDEVLARFSFNDTATTE